MVYYMADYRDEDSTKWFVNRDWAWMDLSELGAVKSIYFTMETTDVGDWGANTTFYFGLDQITIRPVKEETDVEIVPSVNNQLIVYPNPCRDRLQIEGVEEGERISIYNLQGQLVMQNVGCKVQNYLPIEDLSSGVYILKYGDRMARFIKE